MEVESPQNCNISSSPVLKAENVELFFIQQLFPNFFKSKHTILYKQKELERCKNETVSEQSNVQGFDITGSPLKHSFQMDQLEESVIDMKNEYHKEENYNPIDLSEARNLLNTHLNKNENYQWPTFAICDGKDKDVTILLGNFFRDNWFTTMRACLTGKISFNEIKNCSRILQQHCKLSSSNSYDVAESVQMGFQIFGSRQKLENDNIPDDFEGYISLEASIDSLSFDLPSRNSKNNFILQLIPGNCDLLDELWNQMKFLDYLLGIKYKFGISSMRIEDTCDNIETPFAEDFTEINRDFQFLLRDDDEYKKYYCSKFETLLADDEDLLEENLKLIQHIDAMWIRNNLDFTDLFWDILIRNTSYSNILSCFKNLIEEIESEGYQPQTNMQNTTRFLKFISESPEENLVNLFKNEVPLELMIDMGINKISMDYIYLLIHTGFMDLMSAKDMLGCASSGNFDLNKYRNQLTTLARIHICFEFMILLQTRFNCPTTALQSLFDYALNQINLNESKNSFADLIKNEIIELTITAPNHLINEFKDCIPSICRAVLRSETDLLRHVTTIIYCKQSTLPLYVSARDETNENEIFQEITAITTSYKIR